MVGWAFLALERVQIEVLREVAGNAGVAVPEGCFFCADAGSCFWVVYSVGWAVDAGIGMCVVVLVGLAGHALLTIEERVFAGTIGANSCLEIVDLALGTGEAKFLDEVEVVGHEAGNAGVVVPEVVVLALAGVLGVAECLSKRASFAVMGGGVVESRRGTSGADISVEEGSTGWAVFTLLEGGVVDLLVVTEEALELAGVEVLGRFAFYAVGSVPEESSRALASLIQHDHTALAGFAVAAVRIPHRSLRANIALLAVEVWSLFWAVHTLLLDNAVYLIVGAYLADLLRVVEVVRVVAFYAKSAVEEQGVVLAFAGISFCLVDSTDAAGLAGEGGVIVESALLADRAFLAVEVGLVLGTEYTLVEVEVVDGVLGTRCTDFSFEVEVFGEVAFDALNVCEEGFVGWTFTDVPFLDIVATATACLAALDGHVEVESSGARFATI